MGKEQLEQRIPGGGSFAVLWFAFFFHGMTSGFWIPSLTNIFRELGISQWVALAFMVPPLCALVSPLIGGALADQRMAANRLFAWSGMVGAVFLFSAFRSLDLGWSPWWFIFLLGAYSLCSGPMWSLLAVISLSHLKHGERDYPLVRMAATIGWMAGGGIGSYILHADMSVEAGYAATVARIATAIVGCLLPFTPPLGKGVSWKSLLGFDAFGLLKQRDHLVFFVVTTLFSIPLAAFYMYGAEMFRWLGDPRPTATMTMGQVTELVAMLFVGVLMTRFRIKTILLWAMGLSVLRYGMSAWSGHTGAWAWHLAGVGLHGVCYTLYFITAQVFLDRRVDPGMRGQAQGLLAFVSGGLGPCVGAWVCGGLRRMLVDGSGDGWMDFWGILTAMIAVCFAGFAVFYRGVAQKPSAG
ncbi:MFS transporter [Luteolibacter sp. SL250]|uniref:MFS transporter n=1 Tax=Luteolibacter sp. SL250 TaxID=2995170 RepID=UPI002D1E39C4|nr:MFS transporter [Luteolibacter sp. SL250]